MYTKATVMQRPFGLDLQYYDTIRQHNSNQTKVNLRDVSTTIVFNAVPVANDEKVTQSYNKVEM